jgi:PAS domain S-box-containing protein
MEELTRSEARYRVLLRVSTDLIWTAANNDGQKTTDQLEWQAFTGQTEAQSHGFNWLDAVHPDDREPTLTAWRHAVETGTTFKVRQRLRRHDGVYRTMQVRAAPSRDAEGNILEWVGMHTDITDRLAAEADIGLAHEKLESMLTGMTDGLALRDYEGRYTYMSERAAQILGVDRKAVIGKLYWEVFPTARHSEIEVQTRRALETRQPAHFERYLAGSVNKWLEYHYYPTDAGLSVYVRDITERKQAEEALARSEAKAHRVTQSLEAVLSGMTDGMNILDKDWYYTYFNEQGARLLGMRVEDIIGRTLWDVFPLAETNEFGRVYRESVATGKPGHILDYYPEPLNKWIEAHCYPSADGLSVYFRDVTEAKLAEQAIARSEAAALLANVRLEGVLASMTDGFVMLDHDWRFTYFSENGARMLGVQARDQVGRLMGDLYPEIETKQFARMYRQATDTGKPVHFEEYYPEPLNKWLDMHVYPSDEGLAIYFTDITPRKQAEQAAIQANDKLEAVLAGMTDGFFMLDTDWRYCSVSAQGARLLGKPVKEMLGQRIWDVFPGIDTRIFGVRLREAAATGEQAHFSDQLPEPLNNWLQNHLYPSAEGISVYFTDITPRKLAEQAIARSESNALKANEKLEAVLAGMTDGLCILDRDWRLTYLNEQGARVLGVPTQGLLGLCIWELFPPAETSAFGLACHQAVDTGLPVHVTDHQTAPQEKWVESHCYPSAEGLSIYFRDITANKLAEEAIARSEATARKANLRLEAVLAGMTDGLLTLDKDWRYTYFSEQGAALLGIRVDDVLGHRIWDVFPSAEDSLFGRMYRQAVDTRQPVHFEEFYPEPLNVWLECHCYPTSDGLSVYFRDISERKHVEAALAHSEAATSKVNKTLAGVLDSMTDGLNIVDTDWRYTYVNEQSGVLLNMSPAAMLGKVLWDMFPAAAEASFGVKMREAVATGKTTHTLDYYPEPVNKWLECHFFPSSEGLSIYFHDVTAKLEAEEALQRSEKLVLAGKLANSIATEIKSPLEAAANLLILSLQMTLPDPVRANLIRVEQQIAQVARATTQTLRFHRHSTTIPTRVDVSVLLDSALDIFAPRFTAAGINVERDYVSHPRLFCYGDEVRQVFANLLSNALEATPHGGNVCLRVRPSPFFEGVRITIADSGHGVPAALRSRIFDLFVSTKEDSGAGLGLWVSEGIMRKHKGHISMRSRTASPDGDGPSGTVFAIQLPYIGIEPNLASKAASRSLPHPTTP